MPWQERCKLELRIEFVSRRLSGESMTALCKEYGVSRPTGYLWLRRFEETGRISALRDRSHRPHRVSGKTPAKIEKRVCELRRRYGWGGKKLSWLLLKEGIELPTITVDRIIKRNGLLIKEDCHRPAQQRFVREHPNELWQMDFKGPMGRGKARCEPLSVLDDMSRYVTGLVPVESKKTNEVQTAMIRIFNKYGLPESILVDHGVPWYCTANIHGLTKFSVWLMNQNIKLVFSGINHPQTQGKVERFHKTLGHAVRTKGTPKEFQCWKKMLKNIKYEYNHLRPHEALQMRTPSQLYTSSKRQYRARPKTFDYGDTVTVIKLDSHGMFARKGKRYFVSQALAGQFVRVDEIEDCLIATYRKTPVREINLRTKDTSPI